MVRHIILLFFRSFGRHKSTSIINLIGLSIGLACALLIYFWIYDESNFDKFHKNDRNLYKVMINDHNPHGITTRDAASANLGDALKGAFEEVKYAVTTTPDSWFRSFSVSRNNENIVKAKGNFVGKDYFKVFSFDLVKGDENSILAVKNAIAISDELAMKLFKTTDVIGQTLEWKWFSYARQGVITGVYKKAPQNSTYQFDFVLPLEFWNDIMPGTIDPNIADLSGGPFNTFLVLNNGADKDRLADKITALEKSRVSGSTSTFLLPKYSDYYLHGNYENGVAVGGRIQYVRLFSVIAIFILLIACINFMNLSTARSSERMKEIGIKKAMGISRHALIFQFISESLITAFISLGVALLIVALLLPYFSDLTEKHLFFHFDSKLLLSILSITFLTGLVSGSYPAFYLSRFKPVDTLKGKSVQLGNDVSIRKGLVFFQFTISVIFIALLFIVFNQIQFIQSKELGFDKDNVIYFEMEGNAAAKKEVFLTDLRKVPGVEKASTIMNTVVLPTFTPAPGVYWDGKNDDDKIRFYQTSVNYDMIETLDISIAEGRSFSRSFGNDTNSVIVNEAAVKAMGISAPIGKTIKVWDEDKRIVGVVKNFHFNSMHERIQPFIFKLEPDVTLLAMIRINGKNQRSTINAIKNFYAEFNRGFAFDYKFLNDDYQAQYASEMVVSALSIYFGGLAIFISCLGLFGLAAFTSERRVKEIGIRKTFGARNLNIVYVLSVDFLKIVLFAILFGSIISYLISRSWLNNFAYRIDLDILYFLAAGVLALAMALLTIGFQTFKAALASPVKCLNQV